jgi:hypothetical protein
LIAFCGDCPYRRGPVEIAAITLPTIWASVIGLKARESIRGHFSGTLAISKTRALGGKNRCAVIKAAVFTISCFTCWQVGSS